MISELYFEGLPSGDYQVDLSFRHRDNLVACPRCRNHRRGHSAVDTVHADC